MARQGLSRIDKTMITVLRRVVGFITRMESPHLTKVICLTNREERTTIKAHLVLLASLSWLKKSVDEVLASKLTQPWPHTARNTQKTCNNDSIVSTPTQKRTRLSILINRKLSTHLRTKSGNVQAPRDKNWGVRWCDKCTTKNYNIFSWATTIEPTSTVVK